MKGIYFSRIEFAQTESKFFPFKADSFLIISILGPLLFLLYINNIVKDIGSNIRLCADDMSLYIIIENSEVAADILNTDLAKVAAWAKTWLVTFNALKLSLLISRKHNNQALNPPVYMQDQPVKTVDVHKHLGLYFSKDCSWSKQIEYISEKAWARVNMMRKFKFDLDRKSLDIIYTSFIRPLLEYGSGVWDKYTLQEKQKLEKIHITKTCLFKYIENFTIKK